MSMLQGWSRVDIAGRHCEVFQPRRPNPHAFTVVYLHDLASTSLAANPVFSELFDRYGLPVIAPIAGPCWWADRRCPEFTADVTPEQFVRQQVMAYIADRWASVPPRIALLGISMGGQGALRFAFKNPNMFPIAAAISPAIDYQRHFGADDDTTLPAMYDDPEAVRQDTAILHVHPLNWPRNLWFCCDPTDHDWHEGGERLRMKLSALGIPHDHDLETRAGGHSWAYFNHMASRAVAFLAERLERERLRVV
ncbi:MAG TPA: alpha/beta hydrolase-fold protein [Pirellulales bacterium]|nr:alpha/beta hydrolase-fold protein [Pirellulales bacterium]